jgi:hypothetical protein
MYSIQFSDWGLVLQFEGRITDGIIRDWLGDVSQLAGGFEGEFGAVVDLRRAQPESPVVSASILRGLVMLQRAGMVRAAAVVDDKMGNPWAIPDAPPSVPGLRAIQADPEDRWLHRAHRWVQDRDAPPIQRNRSNPDRRATS